MRFFVVAVHEALVAFFAIHCSSSRLTARNGKRKFREKEEMGMKETKRNGDGDWEIGRNLNIVAIVGCSITVKVNTLHKCVHSTLFLRSFGPFYVASLRLHGCCCSFTSPSV